MDNPNQNWTSCSADSGILRKKEEEGDALFVFGYSCKLFRDDEKALYIDQGKHLIPWMGDDALKIDRYDVRGTLYDLSQFESAGNSYDQWSGLTSEERNIEKLCDGERYRALHTNEDEEALYQEEELKRLHQALGNKNYGQVAYQYSEEKSREAGEAIEGESMTEIDEAFVSPPELDIPTNMKVPETTKLYAIIEKTAAFINSQGPQMEILLKMKQASNPQFDFLSFDSPLHSFYRHVLMALKTGRFKVAAPQSEAKGDPATEEEHYLHPTLASSLSSQVELVGSNKPSRVFSDKIPFVCFLDRIVFQ